MVNSYLRDPHERVEVDWQCYGRQRTVVLKYRDTRLERNMLTLTDTIRLKKKGSSCIVVGKKIKQLHWKAVV